MQVLGWEGVFKKTSIILWKIDKIARCQKGSLLWEENLRRKINFATNKWWSWTHDLEVVHFCIMEFMKTSFFQGARLVKQPNQRHTGQRFQKVILIRYNVSFLTGGGSSDAEFSGSPVHSWCLQKHWGWICMFNLKVFWLVDEVKTSNSFGI